MITVMPTKNKDIITAVITNKDLYAKSGYIGKFEVNKNNKFYAIYNEHELIGLAELRSFTAITADAHIYILPEAQKKELSVKAGLAIIEHLKINTKIHKLITSIPYECIHALKYVSKLGFTACGQIKDSIIYNDKLQTMIIFEKEVI